MTDQTCVQCVGHHHPTRAAKERCLRFLASRPNAADRGESRQLECVPRKQRRLGRLPPGFSPSKGKTMDYQGISLTYIGDDDDEGNRTPEQHSTKSNKTKKNTKWARAYRFFEGHDGNSNDDENNNNNNSECVVTSEPRSPGRSSNRSPTRRSQKKTDKTAGMKRCRISVDWGLFPSGPLQHRSANSNESLQQYFEDEGDLKEFSALIEGLTEIAPNRTRKSLIRAFLPRRSVKQTVEQDKETIEKKNRKSTKNKKRSNNDKEKHDKKQGPINLFAV